MLNGFMLYKMRREGKLKKGRKGRKGIKKSQKEFDLDTRSVNWNSREVTKKIKM
jgi:hypothetical protein